MGDYSTGSSKDSSNETTVTWKALVGVGLPVLAVPILVSWALLNFHSGQPHEDSVRHHELSSFRADMYEVIKDLRMDMKDFRRELLENQRIMIDVRRSIREASETMDNKTQSQLPMPRGRVVE